jgi:peptidyl-tRNA hydrolase ICT1
MFLLSSSFVQISCNYRGPRLITSHPFPSHPFLDNISLCPEIEVKFSRSGGSGGQNVNKLNTKAEIRFDLKKASEWIPSDVLKTLKEGIDKEKINNEAVLIVTSTRHRTQRANKLDALEKLQEIMNSAVLASQPKREPSLAKIKQIEVFKKVAHQKRLFSKKLNSMKKITRGKCTEL